MMAFKMKPRENTHEVENVTYKTASDVNKNET